MSVVVVLGKITGKNLCIIGSTYLRLGFAFSMTPTRSNVKNGATPVFPPSVIDRAEAETYCNTPIG